MAMHFNIYEFKSTKDRTKYKKAVEINGRLFDSYSHAARVYQVCTSVISYAAKVGNFRGLPCKRVQVDKKQ